MPMIFSSDEGNFPSNDELQQIMKDSFTIRGVERQIKQAILLCWWIQPAEQRVVEHVEALIRKAMERVLADLKQDPKVFGVLELPGFVPPDTMA